MFTLEFTQRIIKIIKSIFDAGMKIINSVSLLLYDGVLNNKNSILLPIYLLV